MPLPDLIEIVPLAAPACAQVTVPGSKSITNRALILAALSDGTTCLRGALWSEDTQVMVEGLLKLGFQVTVEADLEEACNRTITVQGLGGRIPRGGTVEQPLDLFVGNAGTAARFLAALVCLGQGVCRLHGVPRMHQRPQQALFQALRQLGYRIDSETDRLPAVVHGGGPKAGSCTVSIAESSQFASALLLSARVGQWKVDLEGDNAEESAYVAMTTQLAAAFPKAGGVFRIEADASSGSYFWAAGALDLRDLSTAERSASEVRVRDWPQSTWQIDAAFPRQLGTLLAVSLNSLDNREEDLITKLGANWREHLDRTWPEGLEPLTFSRQHHLGDSIMTLMVLAPFAIQPVRFTDLGRLRVQECERVQALRTELTRCGARVVEQGETLEIFPSALHGAEIETYQDHRMAMCFAILGLKIPGLRLKNPACVKKTFPNFFQKLAAPPPEGLGASLLEASTGRRLSPGELFAA